MTENSNITRSAPSRRQILQGVGVAGSSILLSGVGQGKKARGKTHPERFVGVTYDTVTHKVQRPGTAHIKAAGKGIEGYLKIGGYSIPLGSETPLQPYSKGLNRPCYYLSLSSSRYEYNGLPLNVEFCDYGSIIVGELSRPSSEYGTMAFTLEPVRELG